MRAASFFRITILCVLSSCANLTSTWTTSTVSDGEAVAHIGITSFNVLPWKAVQPDLSKYPFEIDADKLLQIAYSTTSSSNISTQDSLSASLAVKAGSTTSVTPASTSDAGSSQTSLPAVSWLAPAIGLNSQDRYRLTAALEDELNMLNFRFRGVPIQEGYSAFFVGFQVAVQPLARNLPYDMTLDVQFSPNVFRSPYEHATLAPPIYVLPILATDSLEGTQESTSSQAGRNLALAVAGNVHSVSAAADFSRSIRRLQEEFDLRPNSLFTISNSGSRGISIRYGANRFGRNFEMIPQTHSVGLMMLVDQRLLSPSGACFPVEIRHDLYPKSIDLCSKISNSRIIQNGELPSDYAEGFFRGEVSVGIKAYFRDARFTSNTRLEDTPLRIQPRHSAFPLPLSGQPACPSPQSTILIKNHSASTANSLTLNLSGGANLYNQDFEAVLSTPYLINGTQADFISNRMTISSDGLSITFPDYTSALPMQKKVLIGRLKVFEVQKGERRGLVCPLGGGSYGVIYVP